MTTGVENLGGANVETDSGESCRAAREEGEEHFFVRGVQQIVSDVTEKVDGGNGPREEKLEDGFGTIVQRINAVK